VQDVHAKHLARVEALPPEARIDKLCELNVLEQVLNVSHMMVVQDAWQRSQDLTIHGWVYGLHDGLMRDLGMTVGAADDIEASYTTALNKLF
jgi:carbonic anhydrase